MSTISGSSLDIFKGRHTIAVSCLTMGRTLAAKASAAFRSIAAPFACAAGRLVRVSLHHCARSQYDLDIGRLSDDLPKFCALTGEF